MRAPGWGALPDQVVERVRLPLDARDVLLLLEVVGQPWTIEGSS